MKLTRNLLKQLIKEAIGKTYYTNPEVTGVYLSPEDFRLYVVEDGEEKDINTGGVKNLDTLRRVGQELAKQKGYEFLEEKF